MGQDVLIQNIDKLNDTTSTILEDQAIFDHDLKTIRSHREDYEAKLESVSVQQPQVVDNMIKYMETVEDRMRELEKRGGISTPVPGLGPDLPRDPAPELLLRQVTTLITYDFTGSSPAITEIPHNWSPDRRSTKSSHQINRTFEFAAAMSTPVPETFNSA